MATISIQVKKEIAQALPHAALYDELIRVTAELFDMEPEKVMVMEDEYPASTKNVPDMLIRGETSKWRANLLERWGSSMLEAAQRVLKQSPGIMIAVKPFAVDSSWQKAQS